MTKIQYENLTIRQAEVADAKQLAAWWNDGAVMAHAGFPNGLGTTEGAFLHRCTFENWEIGAYGGLGSWVNATGCTFRGNDVGLWLDNRGGATCSGSSMATACTKTTAPPCASPQCRARRRWISITACSEATG